jgi:hypothetical protein
VPLGVVPEEQMGNSHGKYDDEDEQEEETASGEWERQLQPGTTTGSAPSQYEPIKSEGSYTQSTRTHPQTPSYNDPATTYPGQQTTQNTNYSYTAQHPQTNVAYSNPIPGYTYSPYPVAAPSTLPYNTYQMTPRTPNYVNSHPAMTPASYGGGYYEPPTQTQETAAYPAQTYPGNQADSSTQPLAAASNLDYRDSSSKKGKRRL